MRQALPLRGWRRLTPHQAERSVVWAFPPAGAGSSAFSALAGALRFAELRVVQLPGREARIAETPVADLELLADEVAATLRGAIAAGHAFLGHSLGGLLAFEVARRLERRGEVAPGLLVVAACPAPHLVSGASLPTRSDDEVLQRLRLVGGVPGDLFDDPARMAPFIPAIRADFVAFDTYRHRPGPPLQAAVLALGGRADAMVTAAEVEGWSCHTTGAFRRLIVDGDHFFPSTHAAGLAALVEGAMRVDSK